MRPSRIRVFDGLRITTEHLDHLQGAFGSAIEDLRGLAGLGTVQHGLEVTADGGTVSVAPGLAFDRQGRRIACDEVQAVTASFERMDEVQYVCLEYRQVEEGVVEGQPTLIFDSCAVALEPAPPEPADSAFAIARVVNTADGIDVRPVEDEAPQTPAAGPGASAPAGDALRVVQGVVRLGAPPADFDLANLPRDLAEQEIVLPFPPAGLSAHVLVLATVNATASPAESSGAPPEPGDGQAEPAAPSARSQARFDGEASFDGSGLTQFSVASFPAPEFSDGDMARSFIDMPAGSGLEALRSAYLAVRLRRSPAGTVSVACSLEWSGALDDASIQLVRDRKPTFSWQVLFAWKALGAPAARH